MTFYQFIDIELHGIVNTITNYTSNPYIVGYTQLLSKYINQNDNKMLKIIINKLIEWYDSEIIIIQRSEYLSNKEEHKKTNDLLKILLIKLEQQ